MGAAGQEVGRGQVGGFTRQQRLHATTTTAMQIKIEHKHREEEEEAKIPSLCWQRLQCTPSLLVFMLCEFCLCCDINTVLAANIPIISAAVTTTTTTTATYSPMGSVSWLSWCDSFSAPSVMIPLAYSSLSFIHSQKLHTFVVFVIVYERSIFPTYPT